MKCKNKKQVGGWLKEVMERGGEGVILRAAKSLYEHGRSDSLLKLKVFLLLSSLLFFRFFLFFSPFSPLFSLLLASYCFFLLASSRFSFLLISTNSLQASRADSEALVVTVNDDFSFELQLYVLIFF